MARDDDDSAPRAEEQPTRDEAKEGNGRKRAGGRGGSRRAKKDAEEGAAPEEQQRAEDAPKPRAATKSGASRRGASKKKAGSKAGRDAGEKDANGAAALQGDALFEREAVREADGIANERPELLEAASGFVREAAEEAEDLARGGELLSENQVAQARDAKRAGAASPADGDAQPPRPEGGDDLDAALAYARDWLAGLFQRLNLELQVEADRDGTSLRFNVRGDDEDKLLGPHGMSPRLADGIQSVLTEVVRNLRRDLSVEVDVADFRKRRGDFLETLADRLADQVERLGRPMVVAGVNSFERRTIHRRLDDRKSLTTTSQGDGSFRKLRIEPS